MRDEIRPKTVAWKTGDINRNFEAAMAKMEAMFLSAEETEISIRPLNTLTTHFLSKILKSVYHILQKNNIKTTYIISVAICAKKYNVYTYYKY